MSHRYGKPHGRKVAPKREVHELPDCTVTIEELNGPGDLEPELLFELETGLCSKCNIPMEFRDGMFYCPRCFPMGP